VKAKRTIYHDMSLELDNGIDFVLLHRGFSFDKRPLTSRKFATKRFNNITVFTVSLK